MVVMDMDMLDTVIRSAPSSRATHICIDIPFCYKMIGRRKTNNKENIAIGEKDKK